MLIDLSQLVFKVSCEVHLAGERIEYAIDGYGRVEACDLAVFGEIKRDIRAAEAREKFGELACAYGLVGIVMRNSVILFEIKLVPSERLIGTHP